MKKLTFVISLLVALGLIGCAAVEKQDIIEDVGAAVGAPVYPDGTIDEPDGDPDYSFPEVAVEVAGDIGPATAKGDWTTVIVTSASIAGAVLLGILRRAIKGKKAKQ